MDAQENTGSAEETTTTENTSAASDVESGGNGAGNGVTAASKEPHRPEVSAATIGRMMGLATASDLMLLDNKIDLLMTRVGNLTTRMERVVSTLNDAPTGSDLERIDVQIAALRTLIKDVLADKVAEKEEKGKSTKLSETIRSSSSEDKSEGE
ncbi:MAG: hypothetical protein D6719_05125 [Candidatus Dadabacteria bacterium]|nr:MAG: hypothetical protein D6719_05125 [Candidatus Dadabacteria bacterium]